MCMLDDGYIVVGDVGQCFRPFNDIIKELLGDRRIEFDNVKRQECMAWFIFDGVEPADYRV